MQSLKSLIAKIEEKRAEAAVSPEDADPRIRAGVEAMVRQAKQAVGELEKEYKEAVMANIVIVAVEGRSASEFANIASVAFDTPVLDYGLSANRIKNNIRERSPRLEFNTQEFFMVLDELNKIKLDYEMLTLPVPKVNPAVDQVYNMPIDTAVDNIVAVNYGESLASAVTRREIGKLALKMKFTGKHMPVVLFNYKGNLDESHLPRPFVTVNAGDGEVSKSMVKEILTEIKTRLSGNTGSKGRRKTGALPEVDSPDTDSIEETNNN